MAKVPSPDALEPLRRMCRNGQLFEVQEWIRKGNPVTLATKNSPRQSKHTPLLIALDRGFHSLVKVLLESGAPQTEGNFNALDYAVQLRRPDLVELLFQFGAQVDEVPLHAVIEHWHPEVLALFISKGASLTRGNPIGWGLVNMMKPALGLLRRHCRQNPQLMEQANIALRYHAANGSPKWVALLLWAGADPWARGPDNVPDWGSAEEEPDEDPYYWNAVELAVSRGHVEVLKQKKLLTPPDPSRPESREVLDKVWLVEEIAVLALLIERGHTPKLLPDKGNSLISRYLYGISSIWTGSHGSWSRTGPLGGIDTWRAQDFMKMMRMLVEQGARWLPAGTEEIGRVRKSLLKMAPKYTFEFVQLLQEHKAARRCDVEELLRTSNMKALTARVCRRIASLVAALPANVPEEVAPNC